MFKRIALKKKSVLSNENTLSGKKNPLCSSQVSIKKILLKELFIIRMFFVLKFLSLFRIIRILLWTESAKTCIGKQPPFAYMTFVILGIGTDIVDIRRVEKVFQRFAKQFSDRILTPKECLSAHSITAPMLAKRFAAKEACSKALKTGIGRQLSFQDIDINHRENGSPQLTVNKLRLKKIYPTIPAHKIILDVSITDEYPYAQAFVVIWRAL